MFVVVEGEQLEVVVDDRAVHFIDDRDEVLLVLLLELHADAAHNHEVRLDIQSFRDGA